MRHIVQLDEKLVNQIAAGEVIDKPASAIKELVENSIDAGATSIRIWLRQGGISLIKIQDNGCGIVKEELPLALSRHATSKLHDQNLFSISSLGFRGEALPSIASISKFSITSRPNEQEEAWKYEVEGGQFKSFQPCAFDHGTEIEIRELFYATPARLKFLKAPKTEYAHIIDVLQNYAMAYPEVSFEMFHDDKRIFKYDALPSEDDSDILNLRRISDIIDANLKDNAIKIDASSSDLPLKCKGYVSIPTYHKSTSLSQHIFINGRPVKDKLLSGVLRAVYADFVPRGRFPVAVLFLILPYEYVDVNVHPAKTEVRFREAQLVRHFLFSCLKKELEKLRYQTASSLASKTLDYLSAPASSPNHTFMRSSYPVSYKNLGEQTNIVLEEPSPIPYSLQETHIPLKDEEKYSEENLTMLADHPLGSAKAQFHQNYILSQTSQGIVLIDQHAAHERLVYEKLKSDLYSNQMERQILLLPEIIKIPSLVTFHNFIPRLSELEEFGLVIEEFGEQEVVVREVPSILNRVKLQDFIIQLADQVSCFENALPLKERINEICATIACHNSVRSGRQLNIHEMNALLREMEKNPFSGQCNHGRPTYITLKLSEIERLFERRN